MVSQISDTIGCDLKLSAILGALATDLRQLRVYADVQLLVRGADVCDCTNYSGLQEFTFD